MAYSSWSVVFGEQPSAAKWNILGTNDASFNDGTGFPNGVIIQVATTSISAVATSTAVIPNDDTIPQISEGTEFMTLAITPKSVTNILVVEAYLWVSHSVTSAQVYASVYQDATVNAFATGVQTIPVATAPMLVSVRATITAGTTSSTTIRIRGGGNTAGTLTVNGQSAGRQLGTVAKSSIWITEYKA